ncbi:MAG: hypothetical protein IJA49_07930 [Oscillospiraceae bacterium]|nr:hypothetical protein [Oscillospiraceae bacterium]
MDVMIGLGAIGALILMRVLANRTDILLGRIMRAWWNISFRIAAYIPFCGWMAHFIIADPEEKEYYIRLGEEADNWAFQKAEDSANAELARIRRDDAIRSKLERDGLTAVSINSDGSFATAKDKHGNSYDIRINYE